MSAAVSTSTLGYAAVAAVALGLAGLVLVAGFSPKSEVRALWFRYEAELTRELRFLRSQTSGAFVARAQLLGGAGLFCLAVLLEEGLFLLLILFVAIVPMFTLRSRHRQRVLTIEQQLDTFLVTLSNALRASPSLGEALATSARLTHGPLAEEIDVALREVRLGSPLDRALLELADRVGSRSLWGAIATLLVVRQTGGDASTTLEEAASTLREMARLDGVVKAKTAEGKSQAYVLAAVPFLLLGAIHMLDNTWLKPLTESAVGITIIGVASILWIIGFLTARRILAVDI